MNIYIHNNGYYCEHNLSVKSTLTVYITFGIGSTRFQSGRLKPIKSTLWEGVWGGVALVVHLIFTVFGSY